MRPAAAWCILLATLRPWIWKGKRKRGKLDEVGRDCAGLLTSLEEIHKCPEGVNLPLAATLLFLYVVLYVACSRVSQTGNSNERRCFHVSCFLS